MKVQYPDVATALRADLANLSMIVGLVRLLAPRVDAERVAQEARERILEELDYLAEARSQAAFGARFEGHPFISVPRVIASHSAAEVLTSEYVEGLRFGELAGLDEATRSRQGEILFRFLFGCLFGWGTFDADPHPGNYLFAPGGGRVTFLDFGCVKRLPAPVHQAWCRFIRARLDDDRDGLAGTGARPRAGRRGADAPADLIIESLTRLYLPFRQDEPQRFPSIWDGASARGLLGGELAEVRRHLRVPGDLVFVNRTMAGMYQVLARLGATANWGRIAREYLFDDPASTPLGAAERAWSQQGVRQMGAP